MPESSTARSTMVFSTTLRSSVELTARPTSPKAVRSRLRACTSSNSRVFSMAITAWSAKVLSSVDLASVNGSTSLRGRARWRRSAHLRAASARRACAAIVRRAATSHDVIRDRPEHVRQCGLVAPLSTARRAMGHRSGGAGNMRSRAALTAAGSTALCIGDDAKHRRPSKRR